MAAFAWRVRRARIPVSELFKVNKMAMRPNRSLLSGVFASCSLALVAGCTGGTTYGTGVSQEVQLLDDISSIAGLGSGNKKKRIEYSSRSKLVKPPKVAALPAPTDSVNNDAGYFPTNPEERARVARQEADAAGNTNQLIPGGQTGRRGLQSDAVAESAPVDKYAVYDQKSAPHETIFGDRKRRKQAIEARKAFRGVNGAASRRYLTEPPKEYRTPADSAETGNVGAVEAVPGQKKKKSILGSLISKKRS